MNLPIRDMAVQVAQLLVHCRSNLASDRGDVATQEVELMQQHGSATAAWLA